MSVNLSFSLRRAYISCSRFFSSTAIDEILFSDLIENIIHQTVEKLFKWLIYHLIIFHISSLFIWKHLISHKNVSSFHVNHQHQENQHRFFRFGQVLSTHNPNGSKVTLCMKSYCLFLWFNVENKPNVHSFSLHCKNMVKKPLYHSLKKFQENIIKNNRSTFVRWIHVNYACYILIGIKLIAFLFYSEPNILPRKFYTQSSFRNTNEYHYINYSSASHLHR
jgi:hypothetical protein